MKIVAKNFLKEAVRYTGNNKKTIENFIGKTISVFPPAGTWFMKTNQSYFIVTEEDFKENYCKVKVRK